MGKSALPPRAGCSESALLLLKVPSEAQQSPSRHRFPKPSSLSIFSQLQSVDASTDDLSLFTLGLFSDSYLRVTSITPSSPPRSHLTISSTHLP